MSITARRALAALVAPALLLSGCGSDDSSSGSAADPAASSSPLSGSPVAAVLDKDTFSDALAKAAQGTTFRARQSADLGLMKLEAEAEGGITDAGPVLHITTTPDSQLQLEAIVADGAMYLKSAEMPVPKGKWLRLDPAELANGDNPLAAFSGMLDPANLVKDLGVIEDVEHLGSEQVDGVAAEHYRVTTDAAGAMDKLGLDQLADDPQLGAMLEGVLGQLPDEIAFDIWLDAEDRPVKYHHEMAIMGLSLTMEQHFYDYGAEVDVTAPDRADTVGPEQLAAP